jgi:hypothetical protein
MPPIRTAWPLPCGLALDPTSPLMTSSSPTAHRAEQPARRASRRRALPVLLVVAVVTGVLAGCSAAPEFDREAAVGRVVDATGGVVDRAQAECYVDQVTAELGTGPLAEGAEPQPEQLRRLTSIKIDCFGVENIGATTSVSSDPPTSVDGAIAEPMAYGDDAALDALWDQCDAGSGLACDQLFDQAPINSVYEEFAGTCGRRTQELRCADVYGAATTLAP